MLQYFVGLKLWRLKDGLMYVCEIFFNIAVIRNINLKDLFVHFERVNVFIFCCTVELQLLAYENIYIEEGVGENIDVQWKCYGNWISIYLKRYEVGSNSILYPEILSRTSLTYNHFFALANTLYDSASNRSFSADKFVCIGKEGREAIKGNLLFNKKLFSSLYLA